MVSNARKTTLPSSRTGVLLFLGPPDWEGQGHLFQEALPGQAGPWGQATPQLSTSSQPKSSPAVAISPPAHTSAKQISGMDQQHLPATSLHKCVVRYSGQAGPGPRSAETVHSWCGGSCHRKQPGQPSGSSPAALCRRLVLRATSEEKWVVLSVKSPRNQ